MASSESGADHNDAVPPPPPPLPGSAGAGAASMEAEQQLLPTAMAPPPPAMTAAAALPTGYAPMESGGTYPRVAHRHLYLWIERKTNEGGPEAARRLKTIPSLEAFYAEVAAANAGNRHYSPLKLQEMVARAPPYSLLYNRTLNMSTNVLKRWNRTNGMVNWFLWRAQCGPPSAAEVIRLSRVHMARSLMRRPDYGQVFGAETAYFLTAVVKAEAVAAAGGSGGSVNGDGETASVASSSAAGGGGGGKRRRGSKAAAAAAAAAAAVKQGEEEGGGGEQPSAAFANGGGAGGPTPLFPAAAAAGVSTPEALLAWLTRRHPSSPDITLDALRRAVAGGAWALVVPSSSSSSPALHTTMEANAPSIAVADAAASSYAPNVAQLEEWSAENGLWQEFARLCLERGVKFDQCLFDFPDLPPATAAAAAGQNGGAAAAAAAAEGVMPGMLVNGGGQEGGGPGVPVVLPPAAVGPLQRLPSPLLPEGDVEEGAAKARGAGKAPKRAAAAVDTTAGEGAVGKRRKKRERKTAPPLLPFAAAVLPPPGVVGAATAAPPAVALPLPHPASVPASPTASGRPSSPATAAAAAAAADRKAGASEMRRQRMIGHLFAPEEGEGDGETMVELGQQGRELSSVVADVVRGLAARVGGASKGGLRLVGGRVHEWGGDDVEFWRGKALWAPGGDPGVRLLFPYFLPNGTAAAAAAAAAPGGAGGDGWMEAGSEAPLPPSSSTNTAVDSLVAGTRRFVLAAPPPGQGRVQQAAVLVFGGGGPTPSPQQQQEQQQQQPFPLLLVVMVYLMTHEGPGQGEARFLARFFFAESAGAEGRGGVGRALPALGVAPVVFEEGEQEETLVGAHVDDRASARLWRMHVAAAAKATATEAAAAAAAANGHHKNAKKGSASLSSSSSAPSVPGSLAALLL